MVNSSITETESMEKLRPYLFWMSEREPRHQLQINRKNKIKMVQIPAAIMKGFSPPTSFRKTPFSPQKNGYLHGVNSLCGVR
jgi:hypothetical protein